MKSQYELLNKEYLSTLMDNYIIPRYRYLKYKIHKSESTNSIYLKISYCEGVSISIRISDHYDNRKPMKQFIINCEKGFTKNKRELLIRTINNSIKTKKIDSL